MKRLLLVYIAFLNLLFFGVYSCKNNDSNISKATIAGTWQLEEEFSNDENSSQLKEFPLSSCDKMTTLDIFESGKFIEKSYYNNFGTGGECIKDTEEIHGIWKKGYKEIFHFIYDKNNTLFFTKSYVVLKNEKLEVTIQYEDPDLEGETILKFIYTKKLYAVEEIDDLKR
ncbi:hypothetical protein [Aquimarina muelleri]|uniref:Lipocalin-like domain-containing protein n=1 Tax=Aquimarina muelleri TaxID=279356 RepID=A0A918N4J4_9FLAO|nr:hypothetical protein [Aquimarina muelleri]MCX2763741.1 hypothetical protein [Aquimarina muelleri]GGX29823.1 hypothetical protein GCM10007384_33730 [Aquimarina muelleri]